MKATGTNLKEIGMNGGASQRSKYRLTVPVWRRRPEWCTPLVFESNICARAGRKRRIYRNNDRWNRNTGRSGVMDKASIDTIRASVNIAFTKGDMKHGLPLNCFLNAIETLRSRVENRVHVGQRFYCCAYWLWVKLVQITAFDAVIGTFYYI